MEEDRSKRNGSSSSKRSLTSSLDPESLPLAKRKLATSTSHKAAQIPKQATESRPRPRAKDSMPPTASVKVEETENTYVNRFSGTVPLSTSEVDENSILFVALKPGEEETSLMTPGQARTAAQAITFSVSDLSKLISLSKRLSTENDGYEVRRDNIDDSPNSGQSESDEFAGKSVGTFTGHSPSGSLHEAVDQSFTSDTITDCHEPLKLLSSVCTHLSSEYPGAQQTTEPEPSVLPDSEDETENNRSTKEPKKVCPYDTVKFENNSPLCHEELLLYSLIKTVAPNRPLEKVTSNKSHLQAVCNIVNTVCNKNYSTWGIKNYLYHVSSNKMKSGKMNGKIRWYFFKNAIADFLSEHKDVLEKILQTSDSVAGISLYADMITEKLASVCTVHNDRITVSGSIKLGALEEAFTIESAENIFQNYIIQDLDASWKFFYDKNLKVLSVYKFGQCPGYAQLEIQITENGSWTLLLECKQVNMLPGLLDIDKISKFKDIITLCQRIEMFSLCQGVDYEKYECALKELDDQCLYKTKDGKAAAFIHVINSKFQRKVVRSHFCDVLIPKPNPSGAFFAAASRIAPCNNCAKVQHYLRTLLSKTNALAKKSSDGNTEQSKYRSFDTMKKDEMLTVLRNQAKRLKLLQTQVNRFKVQKMKWIEFMMKGDSNSLPKASKIKQKIMNQKDSREDSLASKAENEMKSQTPEQLTLQILARNLSDQLRSCTVVNADAKEASTSELRTNHSEQNSFGELSKNLNSIFRSRPQKLVLKGDRMRKVPAPNSRNSHEGSSSSNSQQEDNRLGPVVQESNQLLHPTCDTSSDAARNVSTDDEPVNSFNTVDMNQFSKICRELDEELSVSEDDLVSLDIDEDCLTSESNLKCSETFDSDLFL